jgi:hypothetical protein
MGFVRLLVFGFRIRPVVFGSLRCTGNRKEKEGMGKAEM